MKRYSLEQFGGYYKDHRMEEDAYGDWVRFEDFQALLEDRDRLCDQLKHAEQGRDVWMRVAKKHPPAGCGSCGVDACCPPEECAHKPMFDAKREDAFKAGYHCQWIKSEMRYIFDPNMSPGDPDGAFKAWLAAKDTQ